jgi:UDP-N-acetylmuramoylalanine-D-glutamate ligase
MKLGTKKKDMEIDDVARSFAEHVTKNSDPIAANIINILVEHPDIHALRDDIVKGEQDRKAISCWLLTLYVAPVFDRKLFNQATAAILSSECIDSVALIWGMDKDELFDFVHDFLQRYKENILELGEAKGAYVEPLTNNLFFGAFHPTEDVTSRLFDTAMQGKFDWKSISKHIRSI